VKGVWSFKSAAVAAMLALVAWPAAIGMTGPTAAATYPSPDWNLTGTYTIPFTCVTGCPSPPDYPYSITITTTSDTTGAVAGTGYYIAGGGTPAVTLTGQVTGWNVELDLTYDDPGLSGYNPFVLTGAINANGGMAGTAADGAGRTFTWQTTSGTVSLFSPRCDYGSYTGYDRVWDGFVPGYGSPTPTVDTGLTLVSGLTYRIEASGTYFAGGNGAYDIEADAEYSQDAYQRTNALGWTDAVHNYGSYGESLLDLLVNGTNVDWGSFATSHTYTLDVAGNAGPLTFNFQVNDFAAYNNTGGLCVAVFESNYDFTGFFAPIDNEGLNGAKAGSAIPVKFSLDGNQGLDIFWTGYPKSQPITCDSADLTDVDVDTVTAGGSMLTYDPTADQYVYVWKTLKSWSGMCRQLQVKLADGTMHTANFTFH
jgi:hypothetical protein